MVTVRRALAIIQSIQASNLVGVDPTINQISKPIMQCSRATIYRAMPHMVKLGLIEPIMLTYEDGNTVVYQVTSEGEQFAESCKVLL